MDDKEKIENKEDSKGQKIKTNVEELFMWLVIIAATFAVFYRLPTVVCGLRLIACS